MSTNHALGSVSLDQRRGRSRRWLVPLIVGGLAALVILGLMLPAAGRGSLQPALSVAK